ncbi:MAG TPA: AI-2E family transporter [Sporichthya sp.]|nr:AI-2E family transporter [Sporichthya sp.]
MRSQTSDDDAREVRAEGRVVRQILRRRRSAAAAGNPQSDQGTGEVAAEEEAAVTAEVAAVSAAVQAGLPEDALLLDEDERRIAAGVNEDQPFGTRGTRGSGRGPVGTGFSVAVGVLLAILLAYALVAVRHQLILLLIAGFVAIGLDPAVRALHRRGLSRPLAVLVVSLGALALLVGFIAAVAAPLAREGSGLIDAGPGYLDQLQDRNSTLGRLAAQLHLTEAAQSLADDGMATPSAGGLLSVGTRVVEGVFDTVVVLALIVYFLADLPRITAAAYRLAPRHRRPRIGLLGDEIIAKVGGFVLGNVVTSLIAIAFAFPALLLLHVPYALVLAVVIGVLDLIPLVGSTIGGAIAAAVALAAVGVPAAISVIVFTVAYRLLADYLINPAVLRRTVEVRPIVTVVSVVIGGGLLGVVGALVAVPTAAAIQLLLTEVVYPARDEEAIPAPEQG